MSHREWSRVRTGRWCLPARSPRTASHPDTRCWSDYGVACKRLHEWMEPAKWYTQSRLSETGDELICVASIYFHFVTTWEWIRVRDEACWLTVEEFCFARWDSSRGHALPCEVALLCVLRCDYTFASGASCLGGDRFSGKWAHLLFQYFDLSFCPSVCNVTNKDTFLDADRKVSRSLKSLRTFQESLVVHNRLCVEQPVERRVCSSRIIPTPTYLFMCVDTFIEFI